MDTNEFSIGDQSIDAMARDIEAVVEFLTQIVPCGGDDCCPLAVISVKDANKLCMVMEEGSSYRSVERRVTIGLAEFGVVPMLIIERGRVYAKSDAQVTNAT